MGFLDALKKMLGGAGEEKAVGQPQASQSAAKSEESCCCCCAPEQKEKEGKTE